MKKALAALGFMVLIAMPAMAAEGMIETTMKGCRIIADNNIENSMQNRQDALAVGTCMGVLHLARDWGFDYKTSPICASDVALPYLARTVVTFYDYVKTDPKIAQKMKEVGYALSIKMMLSTNYPCANQ